MNSENMKIEKASISDMNEIVKMAFIYHKEDPKFKEILSNPVKSFFYRLFGPVYVWLKFESFKAVISGRMIGYILLKYRKFSIHIWDLVVQSEFRSRGIGTSLLKFAEEIAENKYQYLTLAVLENNTKALRLYQKLGYKNLQFSPVCFRIKESLNKMIGENTIKLEPISGQEALSCRDAHFFDVVEAVSGFEGREIVRLLYPPSSKLRKRTIRFRITSTDNEIGYLSFRHTKGLTSVFFILHQDFWGTNTEVETTGKIIRNVCRLSKGQIEIRVMQAYEKSLQSSFKKTGITFDRVIPRLGLIKKI